MIEGAASYGSILAGTVAGEGYPVAEAARMDARSHRGVGKSDELDAQRIARAVLRLEEQQLCRPRLSEGVRAVLRVLVSARDSMTGERTRALNALTALVRVNELDLDGRKALTGTQIAEVSRWRERDEGLTLSVARTEAVRLGRRIGDLDKDVTGNTQQITDLVKVSEAAPLLDVKGFGAITAATCLTVWSHQGRVHSEDAYASLAGVYPIPASPGNTVRHWLNRGGDRALNSALHMVAITRMTPDEETREYTRKREAEGLTTKEIRRCIKRYLARRVYRIFNSQNESLEHRLTDIEGS